MTEIYIPLPSKEVMPLYLQQDFDGFLIGIKNFSSNFNYLYNVDELGIPINFHEESGIVTF